jgi:hypothetical protein
VYNHEGSSQQQSARQQEVLKKISLVCSLLILLPVVFPDDLELEAQLAEGEQRHYDGDFKQYLDLEDKGN